MFTVGRSVDVEERVQLARALGSVVVHLRANAGLLLLAVEAVEVGREDVLLGSSGGERGLLCLLVLGILNGIVCLGIPVAVDLGDIAPTVKGRIHASGEDVAGVQTYTDAVLIGDELDNLGDHRPWCGHDSAMHCDVTWKVAEKKFPLRGRRGCCCGDGAEVMGEIKYLTLAARVAKFGGGRTRGSPSRGSQGTAPPHRGATNARKVRAGCWEPRGAFGTTLEFLGCVVVKGEHGESGGSKNIKASRGQLSLT